VKISERRAYAALSVVVAATTGTVLALSPTASADGSGWPATNGVIAMNLDNGGISTFNPANLSAAPKTLAGSGRQPAWSPTGARVASVVGSHLVTQRYDGSDLHSLPTPLGGGTPNHPTYAFYGNGPFYDQIVYGDAGRLEVVPADGEYGPSYLMPATDEPSNVCDFDPTAGFGDTVYFVRSDSSCDTANASIWSYDIDSGVLQQVIANAYAPALSTDGSRMAYVSGTAVFVSDPDGTGAQQVTTTQTLRYDALNWSPDDTALVAQDEDPSGDAEGAIEISVADGTTTALGDDYTTPAWQPLRQVQLARVYGSTSAATNIAASQWDWAPVGKDVPGLATANSAVIVSNANSTFASLAPSLAAKKNGPVLTTSASSLDSAVQTELKRILPQGKTVYVLGGTSIVSSSVSSKLTSMGYKVTRIGTASTRFVTSVSVAKTITSAPKYVFLATGEDYHSILEAEAAAGAGGPASTAVALMTDNSTMTESVYTYLNTINPTKTTVITVGTSAGTALVNAYKQHHLSKWPSSWGYYPVTASTNVGTSVALARLWWSSPFVSTFVDGVSWKDGVAGFSSMATYGPVLWATTAALDSPDKTYLLDESAGLDDAVVFGGTGSLSTGTVTSIGNAAAVPGSWTLTNYPNGVLPPKRSTATAKSLTSDGTSADLRYATINIPEVHRLGTPTRVTR
jgi:ell wall binding domain 2 (CWB2)